MMSKIIAASMLGSALAATSNTAVNPIRRVVTLLQDMQKEINAEGEKEETLYKKFACFCSGNTKDLESQTAQAAEDIKAFTAKAEAEAAEKAQTEEDLKNHKADRAAAKQALAEATKLREKEAEQYSKDTGDFSDNIKAMKGAVATLEKGMGAAAFIQTPFANTLKSLVASAQNMEVEDKETLSAFLQASGDYVPQSGQIVGILKNMLDEMDKELNGAISAEEEAAKTFKEMSAAKKAEIDAATSAIESKTARVGELAVSVVTNKNAAKDATKSLDDGQAFLANLKVSCEDKKTEMAERTKMRNDEVAAISQAISVLNEDDALDVFKSALPSPAKAAFIQKMTKKNSGLAKAKVIMKNTKFSSPALNLLSNAVQSKLNDKASKVDFTKVVKMIDDMVALLSQEQKDDKKHSDFCSAELDKSADEKKATEEELSSLASSISDQKDEIAGLSDAIAKLQSEIAGLDKAVADATSTRKEEHEDFTEKIQLNTAAVDLIFKAKNRLNKFYNPNLYVTQTTPAPTLGEEIAAGTAFVQLKKISLHMQSAETEDQPATPETWEGDYKVKGQKSNSVIALMDKLSNDLKSDITEAENEEKVAVRDYEALMKDSADDKAAAATSITDKSAAKASLEAKVESNKEQSSTATESLANIEATIADLHASCDFILAHFGERKEARTAEIEGLKNAKAVLSGAGYSM